MPLIMRGVNRPRWHKKTILLWLERNEVPADPLTDLRTTENSLSVFLIEDDKSNLKRVVTALSATRHKVDKYDYLLFDAEILSQVNIKVKKSEGETPDNKVNECHLDLVQISGDRLLSLVRHVLESDYETGRYLPKEIKEFLTQAIHSGQYEPNQVKPSL